MAARNSNRKNRKNTKEGDNLKNQQILTLKGNTSQSKK